jgi:DNA polymerase V
MDGSVSAIHGVRRSTKLARPMFGSQLPAGFPVLTEDWVEERIDLNRDLIFHPLYTYYAKIAGDSMIGEGLYDGSLVAFDSTLEAYDGDIVVARVGCSDLCCKIYRDGHDSDGRMRLEPANPDYSPILISEGMELHIIGLVTFSVNWHAKRYGRRLRLNRLQ